MVSQVVHVDALRTLAFGSITNSYQTLGGAFTHPMRMIRIVNTTNADMLFSFDTVNDNMIVPAGGFVLYDVTTNRELVTQFFVFTLGTQIFVKYASGAPTQGTVYLECLYGQGE